MFRGGTLCVVNVFKKLKGEVAGMAELADAGDSKSPALRGVRVRLPLPARFFLPGCGYWGFWSGGMV